MLCRVPDQEWRDFEIAEIEIVDEVMLLWEVEKVKANVGINQWQ